MELRLGFRRLRSDLLLTITAVVSLAIGIGANTAIYTVAGSLLVGVLGRAACGVPLWRALHIAPTEALRDE